MWTVAPHLKLAAGIRIANAWLLLDRDGRRFLVDTGHHLDLPALMANLWSAGVRRRGDLTAVLLTHRHSDHASNAWWVRRRFGCPVICHARDAEILSGAKPRPRMALGRAPFYQEWILHFEDRFPASSVVDDVFEEGPWKWGFRVVHTPGHTEGSVLLHHEPTATLFSGDAILAGPAPLRCIERLRLAIPAFSNDVHGCRAMVRRFLRELPRTEALASGHGPPILESTHEKLFRLGSHGRARGDPR